ncbi:hypothetical protein RGU70_13795 [Herbaspirillum sp. RTI4]|uniref:hypothetical protein n=1 Tax=Herbaspirillum sp. RTI4 TaxID=3048640 RepID=UPI002AB3A66F|nr:hypothetical protein [Herbaspirillum sp. RTI4]MDY7579387.1 hypothetical protein [Herbaspirillum sp. RTI4]MEA9980301.1 hypothetical protein [Herbaspirillum sp. RTI4]
MDDTQYATDFTTWSKTNLARLVNDLRERNAELENEMRTAIDAYRALLLVGVAK